MAEQPISDPTTIEAALVEMSDDAASQPFSDVESSGAPAAPESPTGAARVPPKSAAPVPVDTVNDSHDSAGVTEDGAAAAAAAARRTVRFAKGTHPAAPVGKLAAAPPTDDGVVRVSVSVVHQADGGGLHQRAAVKKPVGRAAAEEEEEEADVARSNLARFPAWMRFIPAMLVWPVWLFIVTNMSEERDRSMWADVFEYWPASVAMVLGSFIAGSTPLGGGVVAFPVSVLVLEFTAEESRDASVLVQAIGMTSASFLLFVTKPHLLHGHIMAVSCLGGVIGVLIGLAAKASPSIINFIYTVTVLLFGGLYWYTNYVNGVSRHTLQPYASAVARVAHRPAVDPMVRTPGGAAAGVPPMVGPLGTGQKRDMVLNITLLAFAVLGGFITGNVGSGSDMMLYVFGIYVWNTLCPEHRLSDNAFTASSVVVMATMSVVTAMARALTSGFSTKVMRCWGAMAFVVCIGAPVGSMVLTPAAVPYLRALFYALAILQFAMFAGLKIQDNAAQWVLIVILVAVESAGLFVHYRFFLRSLARRLKRAQAAFDTVAARERAASAEAAAAPTSTTMQLPPPSAPPAPTLGSAAAPAPAPVVPPV